MSFKISVEKGPEFNIEVGKPTEPLQINGEPLAWNLVKLADGHFHILHQDRSYRAELVKADYENKHFVLKVNGQLYTLNAKDRFDLLLEQMGMGKAAKAKLNDLKAPMPGAILSVAVSEGAQVKKGEVVLILEAMKMENVLKAPGDATIKAVKVAKGDNVEKNQVLVLFE
ncbi:MAG: acetyl-CoA carboxylase biotin carboxyl carrier protein subunit [Bernardetiaceae bacterium]|jgi:biotin carboxyl carrier protein|nr:acetyl-CoA carboxylase biotin carboxyl carrier protein subunit [Bernardetiaceae bacterium]